MQNKSCFSCRYIYPNHD